MRASPFAWSVAVGLLALACPRLARAEDPPLPPPAEPSPPPVVAPSPAEQPAPERAPRYDVVRVNLGLRIGYVPSRAFDPFSTNDVLPQWSLDATYPVFTRKKLAIGVGVGWDFGASGATVRSFDAKVSVHRLYVPVEARYSVLPGLVAFGKVAPGAVAALATVHDPSAPDDLSATGWAFSADASVGAAILLGPRTRPELRQPRVWVSPELGYAFTTKAPLNLNAGRDDKDVLGSDEDTHLRSLALSGFFWKASVGMTF